MPISNFANYKSLRDSATPSSYYKVFAGTASGKIQSSWTGLPFAGVAPTSPVAVSQSTTGAITWQNLGLNPAPTKVRRLAFVDAKVISSTAATDVSLLIIDRLSHQGGMSATVTGVQTLNLPTAALTRYTSGEGVMMAVEIYTLIGTTATTFTVSYTNQAGTSGRTSPATVIGGAADRAAGMMLIVPLQDGDTGVRSVESINLLASTTTAGNIGITLFKILDWVPATKVVITDGKVGFDAFLGGGGLCPIVDNNACLQFCAVSNATSSSVAVTMKFIEDDV